MSIHVNHAVRHSRLRWVGAPLLLSGVGLLGYAVFRSLVGGSGWTVAFAAFGTGMALAAFGANHDAAMGYAFAGRDEGLPPDLKSELDDELERDRDGVISVRPVPTVGMVMPFVALFVQLWVAWRLFGGPS